MKHLHRRPSLRLVTLFLAFCTALMPGLAALPAQAAATAISREIEPVVVSAIFAGAPVDEVFVYKFTATDGWQQIVYQVDERNAEGEYTASEDGVMDANDEVVFMAGDLGEQATTPISETLPVSDTVLYEIEVTNPLNATEKGWAYVVKSNILATEVLTPYVEGFEATDQVISAQNYEIGWAEDFGGLDYLALFGGPDILDRTKLQAVAVVGNLALTLTEEAPALKDQDLTLDKAGPVRVIVHVTPPPSGTNLVNATTIAYGSYIETATRVDASALPGTVDIKSLRLSTDLLPSAAPATYYNELTPAGVTVDGVPDMIAGTAVNQGWRQVSLDNSTTVQVFSIEGELTAGKQHYYLDDSTPPGPDTGDGQAIGDSGLMLLNPEAAIFTIHSAQYFLPGKLGNVGATWFGNDQSPLTVKKTDIGAGGPEMNKVYLPIIVRS